MPGARAPATSAQHMDDASSWHVEVPDKGDAEGGSDDDGLDSPRLGSTEPQPLPSECDLDAVSESDGNPVGQKRRMHGLRPAKRYARVVDEGSGRVSASRLSRSADDEHTPPSLNPTNHGCQPRLTRRCALTLYVVVVMVLTSGGLLLFIEARHVQHFAPAVRFVQQVLGIHAHHPPSMPPIPPTPPSPPSPPPPSPLPAWPCPPQDPHPRPPPPPPSPLPAVPPPWQPPSTPPGPPLPLPPPLPPPVPPSSPPSPSPSPPVTWEDVAERINERWRNGHPSIPSADGGVTIRILDRLGNYGRQWMPTAHDPRHGDRWSASVINAHDPFTYEGPPSDLLNNPGTEGLIISPAAVDATLLCAYPSDGGSLGFECSPPGARSDCVPGCRPNFCPGRDRWWGCAYRGSSPLMNRHGGSQLDEMLYVHRDVQLTTLCARSLRPARLCLYTMSSAPRGPRAAPV